MQLKKHASTSPDVIPLLAALSYSILPDEGQEITDVSQYDPTSQRTVYSMGNRHSTCRVDDSVGGIFDIGSKKSDTKRDD